MNVIQIKAADPRSNLAPLISAIKEDLENGAHAASKSERYYLSAGSRLKELKACKPSDQPWPAYVKKHFGLSQERADELIRIAEGKTTVSEVRAKTAQRVKKNRAKSVLRNTGTPRHAKALVDPYYTDFWTQRPDVSPEVRARVDELMAAGRVSLRAAQDFKAKVKAFAADYPETKAEMLCKPAVRTPIASVLDEIAAETLYSIMDLFDKGHGVDVPLFNASLDVINGEDSLADKTPLMDKAGRAADRKMNSGGIVIYGESEKR